MKKKVFLAEDIHQDAKALLEKSFEIISHIDDIEYVEAIITRNIKIDKAFIDRCCCLKVVAIHGTGYDDVDIDYLKEKNIAVFHVPGENALSVAELTVALILNLARKVYAVDRLLQEHQLIEIGSKQYEGMEISYKTVGMIGFGNTARKTAYILQNGFMMKVIVYSPSLTLQEAKRYHVKICQSLEELFEKADIVCVHCSLNEKTKNMINLEVLKHAKRHCLFVNTARGAVVNEHDLYVALKNNIIKGAASDVFVEEPPSYKNPLLSLPCFLATPHLGATTDEALYRVGMKTVNGIIDYFAGKEIENKL